MKVGDKLWMVIGTVFKSPPRQEAVTVTKIGRKYAYLSNLQFRVKLDTWAVETNWTSREAGYEQGRVWESEDDFLYACRKTILWGQIRWAIIEERAVPPESYEDMLRIARDLQIEIKQ